MKLSGALSLAATLLLGSCAAPGKPAAVAEDPRLCVVPANMAPAPAYTPPADEVVADEPTAFYMLALTWAPEDCRANGADRGYWVQCRTNNFGFVVHGLWPNGAAKRHPRYCGPAPEIADATMRKHACMTPSTTMLQHEWAAHGTCGWESPEAYFAQSSKLWRALEIPRLTAAAMTAGEVRDAFVAANPSIPRQGVYIKATPDSRLMDVRLCYDLDYRPMACKGSLGPADDVMLKITPLLMPGEPR